MTAIPFPRFSESNYRVTSPATPRYNCVAWAAQDAEHWWQPGNYWPTDAGAADCGFSVLEQAFEALGYFRCGTDARLEPGFEKVALFGSNLFYTHAARQMPTGKWTSKLGRDVDIEHDSPDTVAGGVYGELILITKRARLPE